MDSHKAKNGDIFNLSITELLLVIMFSLLIVMVVLNSSLRKAEQAAATAEKGVTENLNKLTLLAEKLGLELDLQDTSKAEEAASFSAENNQDKREDTLPTTTTITEAQAKVQVLAKKLKELEDLVANLTSELTSEEAQKVLTKSSLAEIWTTISRLQENDLNVDELIKQIAQLRSELASERERANDLDVKYSQAAAIIDQQGLNDDEQAEFINKMIEEKSNNEERIKQLISQVQNLASRGKVLPPCWATEEGRNEYTFNIEINNDNLFVIPDYPSYRSKQYYELANIEIENKSTSYNDFIEGTMAFYDYGRNSIPECRFYVRLFDRTSDTAKDAYKKGRAFAERIFYIYQPEEQ